GHLGVDPFLVARQATGVDHDIGATLPFGLAVLAITSQAGILGNDGVAAFGKAVEQGGFADVRAAHQGDYGNHAALHCDISENTKAAASSGRTFSIPPGRGRRTEEGLGPQSCRRMVSATSLPPLP